MKNKNQFTNWIFFYFAPIIFLAGVFLLPFPALASAITSEKLIELTNKERNAGGLNSLTVNQLLTQAAFEKARAILDSQTFKHNIDGRKFSSWIKNTDYKYSYVGENLAIDFATSEGTMDAWMNSIEHKKNILNKYYEEIGIAVLNGNFDGTQTTLVVQIFGAPPREILQPRILGLDDSSFIRLEASPTLKFSPESYLTHSSTNYLNFQNTKLTLIPPTKTSTINTKLSKINVNNNFIQLHIIFLKTFFNLLLSISALFLLVYVYAYSFSRLALSHDFGHRA